MNDIYKDINEILNPEFMFSSISRKIGYPKLHHEPYMITAYGIATLLHNGKFITVNYILEDQFPDRGEVPKFSTKSFKVLYDKFRMLTGYKLDTSDASILSDFHLINCEFGELNYRVDPVTDRFWYELIPSVGDVVNFDSRLEAVKAFNSLLPL